MVDPINPVPVEDPFLGAPLVTDSVPIPTPFLTSVKDLAIKVFKNWWIWIILALFVLLGLSECRNRSIQNRWQKSIESEVKKQTSQVIKDQQDRQDIYEKDLRTVQNKLKALDKASKVVDSKIAKTGVELEKVRKEKLSRSDIDKRLDELFGNKGEEGKF